MSDGKAKALAEVRERAERPGDLELVFGEHVVKTPWAHIDDDDERGPYEIARVANAAVEQREAKLRGALRTAMDHVNHTYHCEQNTGGISGVACDCGADEAMKTARAALDGTGPDYVPRAELEAEQAKVKQYVAVMDVLLDVQRDPHATAADMTAVVREAVARLEAAGLRKAPMAWVGADPATVAPVATTTEPHQWNHLCDAIPHNQDRQVVLLVGDACPGCGGRSIRDRANPYWNNLGVRVD